MTKYQSTDQQRASAAWNLVQSVKGKGETSKSFGMHAKKLPVRILASGLGQSIAFLDAKKEALELVHGINEWIGDRPWANRATTTTVANATLMERIIANDHEFLRMATEETLALLQWIVRFSDAEGLTKG